MEAGGGEGEGEEGGKGPRYTVAFRSQCVSVRKGVVLVPASTSSCRSQHVGGEVGVAGGGGGRSHGIPIFSLRVFIFSCFIIYLFRRLLRSLCSKSCNMWKSVKATDAFRKKKKEEKYHKNYYITVNDNRNK
jgi:hypothetical protein